MAVKRSVASVFLLAFVSTALITSSVSAQDSSAIAGLVTDATGAARRV